MHEQLERIPINDLLLQKPLPQRRYFSSAAHGVMTLIALGSRLIICPGDDILAVTAVANLGFRSPDTPREAVLPKPTEIVFEEEDKNRDKNKV